MEALNCQIREVSAEAKSLVKESEDAMLLTSIHGVGHYNALLFIAEIGDVNKFLTLISSASIETGSFYWLTVKQAFLHTGWLACLAPGLP
jgi:transposase